MPEEDGAGRRPIRAAGIRSLIWRLVMPFAHEMIAQEAAALAAKTSELDGRVTDSTTTIRKDLLATNHRITWIDEHGTSASQIGTTE